MKERPILFSATMVRAILEGRKTQTRRVVKPQPDCIHDCEPYWYVGGYRAWQHRCITDPMRMGTSNPIVCPYGQPGDRLWVRESTRMRYLHNLLTGEPTNAKCGEYTADGAPVLEQRGFDLAWWYSKDSCPSIHMPRWASRITLEIVSVRVEQLNEISEDDAIAEGIEWNPSLGSYNCAGEWRNNSVPIFRQLWESINGAGRWEANPWVWVVEFKKVQP